MTGEKVVYASGEFSKLAPPRVASPDWSPSNQYGGYQQPQDSSAITAHRAARSAIDPLTGVIVSHSDIDI